jgi:hypothetical protein
MAAPLLLAGVLLASPSAPDIQLFFDAASTDEKRATAAMNALTPVWRDGYAALFVDLARFMRSSRPTADGTELPVEDAETSGSRAPRDAPFAAPANPSSAVRRRLITFLQKRTGQRFGGDLRAWRRWIWSLPYEPHPDYAFFKAAVYGRIDRRMPAFFAPGSRADIRLDEVDWGGVAVNGIPPLDHPASVEAAAARWLKDSHVVFGIAVSGEARAYPKRILAWHELARDRVGGVELAIVYCTLCGTVIPYRAEVGGRAFTFGTSGLLYRSNKLMFDEQTNSLWNSSTGRPVIGELAGAGLELRAEPVVTTTWGEWRALHPRTTVLDRDTGHRRDYSEGAAYREYFATDDLMFEVPGQDDRLKNKAEILGLLLEQPGSPSTPRALAFSAEFLRRNPVHHQAFAGRSLVVVTSPQGANRVYATDGRRFEKAESEGEIRDEAGVRWTLTEEALKQVAPTGVPLSFPRLAARRSFWFGWHAQFPHTELVSRSDDLPDLLQRFTADIGNLRPRRGISDRDQQVGALVTGAAQDLGEESHRTRCVRERGETRKVEGGEQDADGDTDRFLDVVVLGVVLRAVHEPRRLTVLAEDHDQVRRVLQEGLPPVGPQRGQGLEPLGRRPPLVEVPLLGLGGPADPALDVGIAHHHELPGLTVRARRRAGRGGDRLVNDIDRYGFRREIAHGSAPCNGIPEGA